MKIAWSILFLATASSLYGMEPRAKLSTITQADPITDIGECSLKDKCGFYRKIGIKKDDSKHFVVEVHIEGENNRQGILMRDTTGVYKIIRKNNLELGEHKTVFLEEYPHYHRFLTPTQRVKIERYLGKAVQWAEEAADNYKA